MRREHEAHGDRDGALDAGTIVALVAMALGIFAVANDFTALSVAVVEIESDLDTTLDRAQWVINAYTVVFGVLIVTGGRLADMFGRKRVFILGAAIFAVFSLLGGLAPNIELLIASRAIMGVGGALMWPSVLGMTYAILPEDKAGLAGGLVIGVAGLGNATGPLLSGALTDALSWRWVFFVNIPIAAVAVLATLRFVHTEDRARRERIDIAGIASLSAAIVLVLVGLDVGSGRGFGNALVIALVLLGALLLSAFVAIERRVGHAALVPPRVMRNRSFVGALASVSVLACIFFGAVVYVPQFLQNELDWSALEAGAGLLPMMLTFGLVSFGAGPLYGVLGARPVIVVGAFSMVAGATVLAWRIGTDYRSLVPGLVLLGIGIGLFFSALTTAAVTAVDDADSSLAGGIIYMGNIVGGSIGIGLDTAIVLSSASLVDGLRVAFTVNAALGAVGAVVVLATVRGEPGRVHPLRHLHHHAHPA